MPCKAYGTVYVDEHSIEKAAQMEGGCVVEEASVLCAGPIRPLMSQQKSGSFRLREAERLRRFIAARQSSGGLTHEGGASLDQTDLVRATEESDPVAELPSRVAPADAHQHNQVSCAQLRTITQPLTQVLHKSGDVVA